MTRARCPVKAEIAEAMGNRARPLFERRLKRSPLRDVSGMLRSFQNAARVGLQRRAAAPDSPAEHDTTAQAWMDYWQWAVSVVFLDAYLTAMDAALLPRTEGERALVVYLHLVEQAVYELGYELDRWPKRVGIP